MKNRFNVSPISLFSSSTCGRICAAAAVFAALIVGAAAQPAGPPDTVTTPPTVQWLRDGAGQPRGLAMICDLERDADGWELWGPSAGDSALRELDRLIPPDRLPSTGLAVNGGYWNEFQHPVGIAAGAQGIFATRGHPTGFAIAGRRAWIGELRSRARLRPAFGDPGTSDTFPVAINPFPRPKRMPYLVDPKASPSAVRVEPPGVAIWLSAGRPFRFNTSTTLTIERVERPAAPIELTTMTRPLLIFPASVPADWRLPRPGEGVRYVLDARLDPLEEPVRLATCAGPLLVKDGQVAGEFEQRAAWRTAVGIDAEGRRLWVVVLTRGRDGSVGVTLADTARTLQELGAWRGLNLDGGSSTSAFCPAAHVALRQLLPLSRPIHHGLFFMKPVALVETASGRQ
jgi:hypothetical protein